MRRLNPKYGLERHAGAAVRLSIRNKLFITLLLAITLVVAVMFGFMHWSFQRGFVSFLEVRQQARAERLAEQLAGVYAEEGGFDGLRLDRARWFSLLAEGRAGRGDFAPMGRGPGHGPGHMPRLREAGLTLLDVDKRPLLGREENVDQLLLTPIREGGRIVGYVGRMPGPVLREGIDTRFEEAQQRAFLWIALLVALVAMALTWPLSNTLVRPLRRITEGARALSAGRFQTRVTVRSNDELGDLARDFNGLAQTLEQTETARRQWMADISHELRTPLSVMKAELEAMQDGVRPLDPASVLSLQSDVERLNRLVEDLYQLSMTDLGAMSYRKREVEPAAILKDDLESLAGEFARLGIEVVMRDELPGAVTLQGDPDRLSQLFRNLLQNSLRYTDAGGRAEVTLRGSGGIWSADFQDTAPAVPGESLPRLFERFYRVEASRNRAHGGAGLGLAICRNIVEAHGGRIEARPSPLGGLCIHLELPIP